MCVLCVIWNYYTAHFWIDSIDNGSIWFVSDYTRNFSPILFVLSFYSISITPSPFFSLSPSPRFPTLSRIIKFHFILCIKINRSHKWTAMIHRSPLNLISISVTIIIIMTGSTQRSWSYQPAPSSSSFPP